MEENFSGNYLSICSTHFKQPMLYAQTHDGFRTFKVLVGFDYNGKILKTFKIIPGIS